MNTRKVNLLLSLEEAEREAKMYRDLLLSAERQVTQIKSDLHDTWQPQNARYTTGEAKELRRRVSGAVKELGAWVTPRDLFNALPDYDITVIARELKKLSHAGMVRWNGKRGVSSAYRRVG